MVKNLVSQAAYMEVARWVLRHALGELDEDATSVLMNHHQQHVR